MTHISNYDRHDYGQRITYIGGSVSFDKMGAAEYEFGAIERALTAFGLMSRDDEIATTEITLDFSPLLETALYENAPPTEKWVCFHAKQTPPPETLRWLRAKSAPCLISTVGILPLRGQLQAINRASVHEQPRLLYLRRSTVASIRQAVKLHVFDKAHELAERFIEAEEAKVLADETR